LNRRNIIVAPSLLAADPLRFGEELADVEKSGADWHHVDVMDGHFVPNLTYGIPFVAALKKKSKLPLDVHIMITNPDDMALEYVKAGADILVFHAEASRHPHRLLGAIRQAGAKAGLAVNPGTPMESIFPLLHDTDVINVMSVNPGFGGQSFIKATAKRVATLYKELKNEGLAGKVKIQIDGGINAETGAEVVAAGADTLVAGTYVYGAKDRSVPIKALQALAGKLPA
jgi:ribulose-phosphate 3-epimerase